MSVILIFFVQVNYLYIQINDTFHFKQRRCGAFYHGLGQSTRLFYLRKHEISLVFHRTRQEIIFGNELYRQYRLRVILFVRLVDPIGVLVSTILYVDIILYDCSTSFETTNNRPNR